MPITFENIPADLRVPLFYAELVSGGTPFDSAERLVLVGQMMPAGTATLDEPVLVPGGNRVEDIMFGAGSMLAQMVKIARRNAPFQEIWALPVTDGVGATQATGTVDFTSIVFPLATTQAVTVYVGGAEYNMIATTASTAITVADDFVAVLNSDSDAPVSAVNAAGVVTLTAKQANSLGNDVDVRTNLIGDESAVSYDVTITPMAGGAGDPDITLGLANLTDGDFMWVATPYADAVNMEALRQFYDAETDGRWSPYAPALYGHAITAKVDNLANLSTLGNLHNDPHVSVVGINALPTPVWELVAALGAKMALHLSDPPELSRPLHFIALDGVVAPRQPDRFTVTDRNVLLYDGIATLTTDRTGQLQIERIITTYKNNASGATDNTFLDVQTLAQSQYILRYLRNKVVTRHGRQGLADDDAPRIQGITRPRDIKSTLIAGYAELTELGVVENEEAFAAGLVVERNMIDPSRIDVSLPFDVVNQLRVTAIQAIANLQISNQ